MKRCLSCRALNGEDEAVCASCGSPALEVSDSREQPAVAARSAGPAGAGRVLVEWPWADSELVDVIAVGRDRAFSTLAPYIDSYDNISRRHAEIIATAEGVFVRDVGSSNGTFVNNQRIAAGERVTLRQGDEVRFARDLIARIRIRE